MARTITVDTGEELRKFIDQQVKSGSYKTSSEVVRDGLRLLQEQKAASRLALLQKLLAQGEASGEASDWDMEQFLTRMDSMRDEENQF